MQKSYNSGVTTERVRLTEAGMIAPLFAQYREFYGQQHDLAAAEHFLHQRLSNNESVIFVARLNGQAIGFTQLYPSYSSVQLRRVWILNDLFIIAKARNSGGGSALLDTAETFARADGAYGLALETAQDNPAQKLYERCGWQQDGYLHYCKIL